MKTVYKAFECVRVCTDNCEDVFANQVKGLPCFLYQMTAHGLRFQSIPRPVLAQAPTAVLLAITSASTCPTYIC